MFLRLIPQTTSSTLNAVYVFLNYSYIKNDKMFKTKKRCRFGTLHMERSRQRSLFLSSECN